jgi:hypothetical protein
MFNSTSGPSLGELRKGRKLYVTEQHEFFKNKKLYSRWSFHRISLEGVPSRVPETAEDGLILTCPNVHVVTERQFVHDDDCFYGYRQNERFKSFRWLLPHYSFYDVEAGKVFASFGYCHNNYYHDVVEYLFQGFVLSRMGVTDAPLLWMGMPNSVQRELFGMLSTQGISFTCIPSKLSRVLCTEVLALPESHARIAQRAWNYDGELFEQFSGYRDMLLSQAEWQETSIDLPRKIFSTRTADHRRAAANNREFEEYFSSLGHEVLSFGDYSFAEQVALMRNADEIVGMHGANLTNCMFMKSGSRVIELMPHKKESDDAYKRLSFIFDLDYLRIPLIRTAPGAYGLDNIKPPFS